LKRLVHNRVDVKIRNLLPLAGPRSYLHFYTL